MTVKERVGRLSRTVPYLRILTSSAPVLVTDAVNDKSSIEFTPLAGPETLTVSPSNLLKGVARADPARRAMKDKANMVAEKSSSEEVL